MVCPSKIHDILVTFDFNLREIIRETSTKNFGIFKGNPVLNEILVSLINHNECMGTAINATVGPKNGLDFKLRAFEFSKKG